MKMKTGGDCGMDRDEAARAFALFMDGAGHHEIVSPPYIGDAVRWASSVEDAVSHTSALHARRPPAVYMTLNPTAEPLGEGTRTSDIHVARRNWLFLDFDPKRPKDTNATDDEHDEAQDTAERCADWLVGENGWPEPVVVDSGNGWYLLFRLDGVPATDATRNAVHDATRAIADAYGVHVDAKVTNAARLARVPGTVNRKGPVSAERPHRMCRLHRVPADITPVPWPLVEAMAAKASAARKTKKAQTKAAKPELRAGGGKGYGEKAFDEEVSRLGNATEGQRNDQLNKSAFALFQLAAGGELDAGRVESVLRHTALDVGLDAAEIEATLRSARKAGEAEPRKAPERGAKTENRKSTKAARPAKIAPWTPFPVDALPSSLRRLVEDGSGALGCDPVYVALPGLAVLAAAVGNSRCVMLKRSWKEPSILWTVVVGDSGTLKTPAWRLAMAPMYAIQRRHREAYKADMARHVEDVEAAKEAKKKNDKAGVSDKPAEKPHMTRVLVSDITVEKLAEMLEDNRRGLLVSRDELAGWFGSFTKYKAAGAGSDVPNWLEMYQAGPITVDRKSTERKSIFVDHAAVSVTGGIQPGTLARALKEEHFESGLVARLLLAWPPRRPKFWSEEDVPEWTTKKWEECVEVLSALKMDPASGDIPSRPGLVRLSPAAKLLFVKWYAEWAARQDGAEGELAAAFSKIEAIPARLALIHHCAEAASAGHAPAEEMAPESIEAGIALARWFAAEAQRVYTMCQSSTEERATARLVEWVARQGGRVTARDIQRAGGCKIDRDEAKARLDALVSLGLGEWERSPARDGKGRPPADVFVLKMTDDTNDKNDDDGEGEGDGE